jgi:hypothetical protein
MTSLRWPTEVDSKARRERIAVAAMQGLLSSVEIDQEFTYSDVAFDAVKMADALIAELEKAGKP